MALAPEQIRETHHTLLSAGTYYLCNGLTGSAVLNYLLHCGKSGISVSRSFSRQSSHNSKHNEQYPHVGQKST